MSVGDYRISSIREIRQRLLSRIDNADEAALDWSPGNPIWSSRQILHHLAVSEEHFIGEIARVAGTTAVRQSSSLATVSTLEELVRGLREIRSNTEALLTSFDESFWRQRLVMSSHPLLVGRTVAEAVDFMAWHEARHVVQIGDLLIRWGSSH